MNCTSEEIHHAAQLIAYALSPKNRPAAQPEYATLINEYRTIAGVREAATQIASGLKLELIDEAADAHGLIIQVHPGSNFAPTLKDFRATRSPDERIAYGLLFFVIAAYIYPNKQTLADDATSLGARVRITELVEYAKTTCEHLRATLPTEDTASAHLRPGYDHLLSYRENAANTREQKNLHAMTKALVQYFHDEGIFRREPDPLHPGDYIYFARPHYRIQVRAMVREASTYLQNAFNQAQELTQNHTP
ncbi:hypothetical protein Ga0100231_019940 [Opitutaceae bacterium TAV4]|uniref:hypothetical protein n=1 Tax=Geminisphaera colitermitum TaxID=1148786 RepID=UPI0005BDA964|nr:hypothetical protein [Geminisphaera colitermitum]RRJ96194.1 hypothetical protein Ga0100231_019940 [Opitutaceae bacterium TAV4]RRK00336.1 hypothetical protein Ga0100230_020710 [Opitutaceae bacterium TAV3]